MKRRPDMPRAFSDTRLVMVALVLAIVAVVLNTLYFEKVKSTVNEEVFVAYQFIRDKKAGDRVDARDFEEVTIPNRFRASLTRDLGVIDKQELPGYIKKRLEIEGQEGALLVKRHFLTQEELTPARRTRKGMRDVAIPLSRNSTPPSLRPGARVDIYADIRGVGELPTPYVVMQNVTVLSVGDEALNVAGAEDTRFSSNYRKMSIEVTEEEAMALSNVERLAVGGFRVAVRADNDESHDLIPGGGINPQIIDLIQRRQKEPAPDDGRFR